MFDVPVTERRHAADGDLSAQGRRPYLPSSALLQKPGYREKKVVGIELIEGKLNTGGVDRNSGHS